MGGVVQETTTGRIIGLMSSRDYKAGNYSYAFTDRHQPGSSIKPILDYATAFEYLYWSTGHTVSDEKFTSGNWTPKNWDRQYHGNVSLYEALGKSWNAAAVRTLAQVYKKVGKDKLVTWLENLGYNMSDESFSLAYAIGGWSHGTTPLQQAAAYATVANGGTYIQPHTIKKVVINTTGETINIDQELRNQSKRGMTKATAFLLRNIMTTYVKEYDDYSDLNIGYQIGAKTGTTNHDGSIPGIPANKSKDNWLCAYSPDYSWAFWDGYSYSDQVKYHKYITGTNQSKVVAAKIAQLLKKRKLKHSYDTPSTVVQAKMIKSVYPYKSPTSYTPSSSITTAWFVKGHTPSGYSSSSTASTSSEDTINSLSSFSASITSANKIRVVFSAYDPSSDVSSGKVVYRIIIYKGASSVYSQSLQSSSATLNFTPDANTTYRVIGFYSLSSGAKTSNRISRTVTSSSASSSTPASYTVTSGGQSVSNGGTITGSTIYVNTTGDSSSKLTITCGGVSREVNGGSGAAFSVTAGNSYTINVTETKSDGSSNTLNSFSFKVASANDNTTNNTTDNTDNNNANTDNTTTTNQ
jgi:penicillin-binding protein 1A